jgi:hypothetical protein
MNPLDDHELLLWATRAGLTRDEVRQAVRQGLDAGRIPRQGADETQAGRQDRLNLGIETALIVERVGVSPLEFLEWPTVLVEGFQACDIVEGQRNLPVEVATPSQPVSPVDQIMMKGYTLTFRPGG